MKQDQRKIQTITGIKKAFSMAKGKVKWYDEVKGYGFIESEDSGDVFVHRNSLESPYGGLEADQQVIFEIKQGDKGLVAVNVKSAD